MKSHTASHPASLGKGCRFLPTYALALCLLASLPSVHAQSFAHAWTVIKQTTGIAAPEQFYRTVRDASGNVIINGTVDDGSGTGGQILVQKRAAGSGVLLWEKKLGTQSGKLAVDSAGNVIVTGSLETGGESDIFTAKLAAADGAILWSKTYDGTLTANSFDIGVDVALDSSGNAVVTGLSHDATSNYDFYTAKYAAADGALLWERRHSGGSSEQPQAVAVDSAGHVIVAGYIFSSVGGFHTDYYTAKYDGTTGAVLWQRSYNGPTAGGYDTLTAMSLDGSDNVLVTGQSQSDIYTARYASATGAIQWEARHNPPTSDAGGEDVISDSSGNTYVTGYSSQNGYDALTVKYNSAGVQQWAVTFNGSAGGFDWCYELALDAAGNPLVAGQTASTGANTDIYTAKLSAATGSTTWQRIYNAPAGGNDYGYGGIFHGSGSTVAILGSIGTTRADGDGYAAVLNSADGTLVWEVTNSSPFIRTEAATHVETDASSNVIVAGRINDGSATSSGGNVDFHVAKHAATTGALLWEKRYDTPSQGDDLVKGLVLDAAGNVIVTGQSTSPSSIYSPPDFYTAKYAAADGALLWERRYDSAAEDYDVVSGVALDSAGNVFVAGSSFNGAQYDWYAAKYAAADGALLWQKTFNGTGNSTDELLALTVDSAGNLIVGGYATKPGFTQDFHTVKYSGTDGTVLWSRSHSPASGYGRAKLLAVDGSDNVVMSGIDYHASNGQDIYTAKYAAATGTVLWQAMHNGSGNGDDESRGIKVDSAGHVIVTGLSRNASNSDLVVLKYNSGSGALIWSRIYNGPANMDDAGTDLEISSQDHVIVTGPSMSATHGQFYTAMLNAADGTTLWDDRRGTAGRHDLAAALALDSSGSIIAVGGTWIGFNIYDFLTYNTGSGEADLLMVKFQSLEPEIEVEQPATNIIADGGMVSFGNVISGSDASLVFTIKNPGGVNLTGLGITIDGTDASLFTVTASPTAPVVALGSTTFTVRFAPTSLNAKTAALHVASNDADENPYDITLTGTGTSIPPTISDIGNQTVNEDFSTGALAFTIGDADTPLGSLTVSGASSNETLVPNANIIFGGSGANRTVTVTPALNAFGSATITVTVSDGLATASDTFLLTVNPVNDAPSISDTISFAIDEDGFIEDFLVSVGDVETPAASLTMSSSSSNTALVPNANITFSGSGESRFASILLVPDTFGTTTITLSVSDGVLTTSDTFVLTVNPVNDNPTISNIVNQTISEDASTAALSFTVGDLETAAASLTMSGNSSNTTLVPNANIVFGGSGASRTVTVTPAANGFGTATISVVVSDGGLTATDTFLLTVNAVNDPPTISDIADQTTDEDVSTGALAVTVGDVEIAAASLTMSSSSSNIALVPTANIVFGGSGANRTVTVTPAANASGSATITVTVSDGTATSSDTFLLTVNAVNDAPTISNILNLSINEDTTTGALAFTVGDVESDPVTLTLSATTDQPGLVPVANIVFGGSGASRTVTATPLPNQFGSATITVLVSDGTDTTTDFFVLTVDAVNDAPTISDIADQTTDEDVSTGALAVTVGDLETAAASLTMSGSSSNTTLVPNVNIVFGGSGASRTVTVTPALNQVGTTTITVTVSDGTATSSDTFLLTINAVNDAPTISDIADQSIDEDTNTGALAVTVGDVETAAASLTMNGSSSNTALVPNANIVFGGSGAGRTVTVTPALNQFGTATITVGVSDGTATSSDTFLLTVNAVNDAPTISDITDQIINEDTNTGALAVTIGDVETAAASLTMTGSSSNTALVPNAAIIFGGSSANRTVTVTPALNQFGSATITFSVSDGTATSSETFLLTVNAVNDAPTISDIADQSIDEDTNTGALAVTVGDVETAAASLAMTGSSSNTALVPNANIVFGGSGASRTVTVTPAANAFGSTTITVTVSDGALTTSDTFLLTVNAVNDVPTISDIANQGIPKNGSTGALAFTIGDVETAAASLTVSGSSGNTTLVPHANIVISGSGASRNVTVTPATGQFGSATLTITVSDGTDTSSDTFDLTVLAPEIVVEQPLTANISDSGSKDFGGVVTGSTLSLVFTIKNIGNSDLTGLTITKDGADQALFTITASPTAPVSGGGSTTFTVQFAPLVAGPRTAALHIASNDDDEHPFDITLTGNGLVTISQWKQQHFGTTSNSGPFADLADFDRDGISNLIEYAFGLNPTQNSAGQLPVVQRAGTTLGFTFTEPPGITGITYGAQYTPTLVPANWQPVPDTGTPQQHVFTVNTGSTTRGFMRLTVSTP